MIGTGLLITGVFLMPLLVIDAPGLGPLADAQTLLRHAARAAWRRSVCASAKGPSPGASMTSSGMRKTPVISRPVPIISCRIAGLPPPLQRSSIKMGSPTAKSLPGIACPWTWTSTSNNPGL